MALSKPTHAMPSLVTSVKTFAEAATGKKSGVGISTPTTVKKTASTGQKSGLVPAGDVRLTVNIWDDVHQALKIRAVQERTTVGDMVETWVGSWK